MKKHRKQALASASSCIFIGEHEIENAIYTVKDFQKEIQKECTLGKLLEQKNSSDNTEYYRAKKTKLSMCITAKLQERYTICITKKTF